MKRRFLPVLLTLALCLGMLPTTALAVETKAAGAFEVTGESSSYSYADGVLTVNAGADITISMASGANTPTSDRIVVAENATATITLAGVNIEGSGCDGVQNIAAKSAIDLSNGSILTIDLSANTENTLTGGNGNTDGSGAPGIHVPDSASLIIQGEGNLSVSGGTSNIAWGGVGIGGNAGSGGNAGEACGTVIYFVSDNVNIDAGESAEGNEPADDIGGGKGSQQQNGDDGQGIRPGTDGNYTVYGDLTLPCDITIPNGATVTIPDGASLTVPKDVTLTNNGTIQNQSGTFIIDGTIAGSGQHPADSRYSINYEEETITIAEGYEVYTADTGGSKIESGGSITSCIGQDLYIQQTGSETTGRTEITIPARPQAPNISSVSIDYSEEKLKFPTGLTATTLEYATELTNPEWKDVPSGAALSDMGWDGNTAKIYHFRTGATDISFASSVASTTITAPARPAKPADPTTVEVTSNSITIPVVSGQEYRLGPSGEWKTLQGTTGSDGKTVYTYNSLEPGTQYTIETRTPAETTIENKFASFPASVTVTTKYETELGGLTVSGHSGFEGHFQYGDTITVTFTPERKENNSTNALAENTATLTYTPTEGAAVELAKATAQSDGSFELSYDTKEKKLPIGENLTLTVSYGGNGELNPVEETVTLSLDKAILMNVPSVSGNFVYGETLTVNYIKQDDETVTYQWYRVGSAPGGETIAGATGPEYKLTLEDIGNHIYVNVRATDEWHRGSMQSTNQDVVAKAPGSIEIACDSVTYGEPVQPSVTSNTNTGADVTYSYAGTGSTSYGPSNEAPENAGTYTVTATVAETATHTAAESEPVAFTISKASQTAPAAPTEARTTNSSITLNAISANENGAAAEYGISKDGGNTWMWQSGPEFSGLSSNTTYQFAARYAETDNYAASDPSSVVSIATDRRSSGGSSGSSSKDEGPSTGDSDGWKDIQDEIADAEDGDTITIDMGDETEVPAEVFEEIARKDVDVEIDLGGGVSWTVNGQDVPEGVNLSDLDLGVSMDTKGIPANVFNAVTGEYSTVQFTLAHDGTFGFTLTLTAPLGRENAGYWANLYYYNERGRELEFVTSARIARDGSAALRLEHASQYAVVIDDKSHEPVDLPFTDVPEDFWAYNAIQYVYGEGLMAGTSADAFSPDATTTRGQIVTILWRLAGNPVVNYLMDYSDVSLDSYYAEAVRWATSEGIVGGYGGGVFGPDDPITREQLAVMLWRFAQHTGYDTTQGGMAIREYADYEQISDFALEALDWAVSAGIIGGTSATTLSPSGSATRAQVAVILMRFCQDFVNT